MGLRRPKIPATIVRTGDAWRQVFSFARNLQRSGRAFFSVNEIGDPNNATCVADPPRCITRAKREYVIASYLLAKERASAVYITGKGPPASRYGGWSACPECDAPIGEPTSEPVEVSPDVWRREFSSGLVVLNAQASRAAIVKLDQVCSYRDLHGEPVHASAVQLQRGSAVILLRECGVRGK